MQGFCFPHVQSANRQLPGGLMQLVFGGAMCFRGFEMPHRKFHQPFHRVAPWLLHVHGELRGGTTTFKRMIPCRSKNLTRPPGADALPSRCTVNQLALSLVCKSGQLPQFDPGRVAIHMLKQGFFSRKGPNFLFNSSFPRILHSSPKKTPNKTSAERTAHRQNTGGRATSNG